MNWTLRPRHARWAAWAPSWPGRPALPGWLMPAPAASVIVVLRPGVALAPVLADLGLADGPVQTYETAFTGFAADLGPAEEPAGRRPGVGRRPPQPQLPGGPAGGSPGTRRSSTTPSAGWAPWRARRPPSTATTSGSTPTSPSSTAASPTATPTSTWSAAWTAPGRGRGRTHVGHGTFVAGLAAARDDGRGVVGVAPGARLWAVKVMAADSTVTDAALLCGLDWVAQNAAVIDVVNLSLGGPGVDGDCGGGRSTPWPWNTPRSAASWRRGWWRSLGRQLRRRRHLHEPGRLPRGHHRLGLHRHRRRPRRLGPAGIVLPGHRRHVRRLLRLRGAGRHHRPGHLRREHLAQRAVRRRPPAPAPRLHW